MTVRVIRESSEDEMVAVFLRGELLSSRFGKIVRCALTEAGAEENLILNADLDDEHQNLLRREVLNRARGFGRWEWLFGDFPDDVRWERVALAQAEVLAIEYISFDYWVELSGGSRKATDAARRVQAGVTACGVPNDGWLEAADRLTTSTPPPLIVAGGVGSRLVLLEGHVRLTAFALRPEALPPELEVLLGRSPRIGEWTYW